MSLIDAEQDDPAILAAEDEAIRNADKQPEERVTLTGTSLASLIESLTDGTDPHPEG